VLVPGHGLVPGRLGIGQAGARAEGPPVADGVLQAGEEPVKPDPAIFKLALDRLGLPPGQCVFADDTEENLLPAYRMGMAVFHALDEQVTAAALRELLELSGG
jgi:putative hydrolase of the HAD superfamily